MHGDPSHLTIMAHRPGGVCHGPSSCGPVTITLGLEVTKSAAFMFQFYMPVQ